MFFFLLLLSIKMESLFLDTHFKYWNTIVYINFKNLNRERTLRQYPPVDNCLHLHYLSVWSYLDTEKFSTILIYRLKSIHIRECPSLYQIQLEFWKMRLRGQRDTKNLKLQKTTPTRQPTLCTQYTTSAMHSSYTRGV